MNSRRISLRIGGIGLALRMESASMHRAIARRYRGYTFRAAGESPVVDCTFGCGMLSGRVRAQVKSEDCGAVRMSRRDFDSVLKEKRGTARIYRSIYSFDAFLRVITSVLAAHSRSLLIHGSSVSYSRGAYLFPGPSGSGKTTLSRLTSAGQVLNDEISALRIDENGRTTVHGTPFWGEMGTGPVHGCATLAGICFPVKGPFLQRLVLDRGEALRRLLRCVCVFSTDQETTGAIVETAARIVESVPCWELRFLRNSEIDRVLQ